ELKGAKSIAKSG
ncbi:hypothetical protein Tco_1224030, partial [Tanacetum coccineum]